MRQTQCECGCGQIFDSRGMLVIRHTNPEIPYELVHVAHYLELHGTVDLEKTPLWDESLHPKTSLTTLLSEPIGKPPGTSPFSVVQVFTIGALLKRTHL